MDIIINLIVIGVIISLVIAIISWIKDGVKEHKAKVEKKKQHEKQQAWKQKCRNIYYNWLPNIYDKQSVQTLNKAYELLDALSFYSKLCDDIRYKRKNCDRSLTEVEEDWYDTREKIKRLLNYPTWKYGPTNAYLSDSPVYYDLDMKYIRQFLLKRK